MHVEGKNAGTVPEFKGREEDWIKTLDDIIFAFEYEVEASIAEGLSMETVEIKRLHGLKLFARYFDNLWD